MALLLGSGCSPETAPTSADTAGGAGTVDSGSQRLVSDTGSPLATGEGVRGRLVGPSGEPLPYTSVLCCELLSCAKGETDGDGAFAFPVVEGTAVAVKTHADLFAAPRLAAALEPAVAGPEGHDVGEVYVPDLPAGVPVDLDGTEPETLMVGDDLHLALVGEELVPDLGAVLYDVAARRLPDARVPDYAELQGREVLGVWALHPFATRSEVPIGVQAVVDAPDGTGVEVFSISHLDGRFGPPATGTVVGGQAVTDPGQGLEWLTYLVVATAP